jgi:para-aminobenzoate synthetase component 1
MTGEINRLAEERIPFLLIVDFEMKNPILCRLEELPGYIHFKTPSYQSASSRGKENQERVPASKTDPGGCREDIKLQPEPVMYQRYLKAFNLVRENAQAGKTYLTNLTFPSMISTDLSLEEIYSVSRARYKLLIEDRFVVFSPETFVQIREAEIRCFPMKGTIDADLPGARELLLNDEKEMAEHVTIVDLIRNDLSIHATGVEVEKYRYIETLETSFKNLLQASSVIKGQLPGDWRSRLGDIIYSLLPAGSVSGAPKPETLRIIREAEGSDRGYYTGIMGYYDGNSFDSGVLIRYIEKKDGQLVYRSGGGITFLSDARKEYQELIDKVYVPVT